MEDLAGIGKVLESKVVEKAYDDAASKPAKQVGKFAEDIFKTARLLAFPIQITAAIQDKLEKTIERVVNKVPEERRIEPQLQIVGPIYENIKYLNDSTVLYEMFEELLARSLDSERIAEAHPSFIHVISQLSHDEAIILFELKRNNFETVDTMDYDQKNNLFTNLKVEKTTIPKDRLLFPDNFYMYYSHLESLGLVKWPIIKEDPIWSDDSHRLQTGTRRHSKIHLTDFGKFFVNACVPEGGFRNQS